MKLQIILMFLVLIIFGCSNSDTPIFNEKISDFDSGRVKIRDISNMFMGKSKYRELTFRVKYLEFEENVDVAFNNKTEKSNRLKFSFDYIECDLDKASKDDRMWKGCKIDLMSINFFVSFGGKREKWYTVDENGESNVNLIEGREYTVYLRLNDKQLTDLDDAILKGELKEFSLIHRLGLKPRELYQHSLSN